MTTKTKATEDYTGREFVITREFDASRELVFQAWTDPKHLAQWWGAEGIYQSGLRMGRATRREHIRRDARAQWS